MGVGRRDGMDFVPVRLKGLNEVHPEVIEIPGCVYNEGNFHLNRGLQTVRSKSSIKQNK
jgi:hypothetical protein